ncbi:deformed epidermal autoregulatory factor 1 homolog, partial [Physella acuta]|uniref:deformed epidermal autoregulatory factor 1 homolog n=1 Tax=Physella acuta TaxID=109671 RepID=UPI0027DCAB36
MKKRSRRGRGRGKRGAPAPKETASGGGLDNPSTSSPALSEDTEVEDGPEATPDPQGEDNCGIDGPVTPFSSSSNRHCDGAVSENVDSNLTATPADRSGNVPSPAYLSGVPAYLTGAPAYLTGAPAHSSSSNSSVDGDGGSDAGDNEQMHTGFMQTGPKNYRVGSTVVNLNNCSDDDITPEFRQNDICLQVECGENRALMYMSKLYQGSKGKCIELGDKWYTPNEFQAVSGRESAKDWKRSIRHHGRSLKLLLSKNVLDVHPAACRCDSCSQLQLL